MAKLRRPGGRPPAGECPWILRPEVHTDAEWWTLNGGVPAADLPTLERVRPALEMFLERQPELRREWLTERGLETLAVGDPGYQQVFPYPVERMTLEKFAAQVDAGTFDG